MRLKSTLSAMRIMMGNDGIHFCLSFGLLLQNLIFDCKELNWLITIHFVIFGVLLITQFHFLNFR